MVWIRLPQPLEFDNELLELELAGRRVCLAMFEGHVYAFNARCPHAAAPLLAGYVDVKGNIVCPVHFYKFSIKTGRNTSGEGYQLKTYPIEEREDGIYIFLELLT